MTPRDNDTWFEDDELEREGGVFVSKNGGHEVGCDDDECAPDDYVEDPVNDEGVPGTVDDLPYDYGVETPRAADEVLESHDRTAAWGVGETRGVDKDAEAPLGRPEERELWRKQKPLIEESEREERHYAGLRDEDIPDVADASAEDAAEVLPDAPEGTSATGEH